MNAPLSPDGRQFWNGSEWRPVPQGVDKFWNGTEWQAVPKPGPEQQRARRWRNPSIAAGTAGAIALLVGIVTEGGANSKGTGPGFIGLGLVLLAVCVVFAILDRRK